MEELFVDCPHCWERVSILVDVSCNGRQDFVEDCEVCCNPLAFDVRIVKGRVAEVNVEAAQ